MSGFEDAEYYSALNAQELAEEDAKTRAIEHVVAKLAPSTKEILLRKEVGWERWAKNRLMNDVDWRNIKVIDKEVDSVAKTVRVRVNVEVDLQGLQQAIQDWAKLLAPEGKPKVMLTTGFVDPTSRYLDRRFHNSFHREIADTLEAWGLTVVEPDPMSSGGASSVAEADDRRLAERLRAVGADVAVTVVLHVLSSRPVELSGVRFEKIDVRLSMKVVSSELTILHQEGTQAGAPGTDLEVSFSRAMERAIGKLENEGKSLKRVLRAISADPLGATID